MTGAKVLKLTEIRPITLSVGLTNGVEAMQGERYSWIDGSHAESRQRISRAEERGVVVSLMTQLGANWSAEQRIRHLGDLIAAKAYRPNSDRMADGFLSKSGSWDEFFPR